MSLKVENSVSNNLSKINQQNQQYVSFQASKKNSLEKNPSKDTIEKESNIGGKIAIGTLLTVGILALIDTFAFDAKHLKKIFNTAKKESKNINNNNATQSNIGETTSNINKNIDETVAEIIEEIPTTQVSQTKNAIEEVVAETVENTSHLVVVPPPQKHSWCEFLHRGQVESPSIVKTKPNTTNTTTSTENILIESLKKEGSKGRKVNTASKNLDKVFEPKNSDNIMSSHNKNTIGLDDVDDLYTRNESSIGLDDADDLLTRRGSYGQNLDDPTDPMNAYDIMSPYYKDPTDPFGF